MKLVELKCPGCNALINVNTELSKGVCNYCGREFLVDDEKVKNEITNGVELGYEQEVGRREAIEADREELLELLKTIKEPLKEIESFSENYEKKKKICDRMSTPKKAGTVLIYGGGILLGFVIGGVYWGFLDANHSHVLWLVLLMMVMSVFSAMYVKALGEVNYSKRININAKRLAELVVLKNKYEEIMQKYGKKIDSIPVDYRYSTAVDCFYKYVNNRRADTLKQAMNLYEEEMHRLRIENTQEAILRESRKQSSLQAQQAALQAMNLMRK